jgi:DNA replication protein DnaC
MTTPDLEPNKPSSLAEFTAAYPDPYIMHMRVPANGWKRVEQQASVGSKFLQGWTASEQDSIAQGKMVCPACLDRGKYYIVERGKTESTEHIFRERYVPCRCQAWKYMWKVVSAELRSYSFVSLDTLAPDYQNRLPIEVQQDEINFVKEHRDENFWFIGSPGTGKTTLAYALYRWAHDRDQKCSNAFWKDGKELSYDKTRWIWRGNFDSIHAQCTAKLTNRDAPEPYVTADKIYAAKDAGYRPFLIIEEVDKTKLNEYRADLLFHLVDAIINTGGQLVMTSNLDLNESDANFLRQEETRVVGTTIVRRLTDHVNVRNYFKFHSDV